VAENVAYRLEEEGVGEEETEQRVRESLRLVELEQTMDKLPDELSGGMRRRVSIARAIASRPPIVLYDSPTAGLDPLTSQTIITLILRLRDSLGVTSLLATHRLQDAFGLANYEFDAKENRVVKQLSAPADTVHSADGQPITNIMVLREGRVYFEGGQKDMLESQDEYLKRFLV
jgi:phospholipid/cholesterol/gamma-HCH transport system ATP-binding protein